jgi:Sec-independent protein translocase protein TatA
MNIFGVGGMELALILVIMLVVAGPKRMIRWAYIVGQYTAKMRAMWDETVSYLQKEFDEAGLDVEVPKQPPTRASLNKSLNQALSPVTKPIQESLDEVNKTAGALRTPTATNGRAAAPAATAVKAPPQTPPADPASDLGTWSGGSAKPDTGVSDDAQR